MRPASPAPILSPARLLAGLGLAGLAGLTLASPGATRMWSAPWTIVLAFTLAIPAMLLALEALARDQPFRLPPRPWLLLAAGAAGVPLASAVASPHRGPALLLAAFAVAGAALFLLLHARLASDPFLRWRIERGLAIVGAAVVLASLAGWASNLVAFPGPLTPRVVLEIRNPYPLGHSNYTAGLMLLALPWLALAAARTRGFWHVAAAAVGMLALLNLFTSGSRGGLLGLAALGGAGLLLARPGRRRLLGLGAILLAGVALLAFLNPRVRDLLLPADPAAAPNQSQVQRTAMLAAGARLGAERPLLGWGPGTTPLVYPRQRAGLDGGAENVLQLHSTPVQLWAETGLAGIAVALLGLGLAASRARTAPVAAASLAGYAVFALTDYQLDVPCFVAAVAVHLALLAPPGVTPAFRIRWFVPVTVLAAAALVGLGGRRERTAPLNVIALGLAREPAQATRALALLRESLALDPAQEIAHFNLGWLLVVREPAAAEAHFRAAARLVPDKGGVYFGLALSLLNQGHREAAARALALECLNEPLFLASPWWTVPEIAALRPAAEREFAQVAEAAEAALPANSWAAIQAARLVTLAPQLGRFPGGPERAYRRERPGYPVLMRNADLPAPADLYDVREDPHWPERVPFPLPSKGWLPSPVLLRLLDGALPARAS